MPLSPQAKGEINNRKEVFTFLKGGFEAQVALSEELRSKDEIVELLNPYFSESFQQKFWKENVVKENNKYITYGSDFAQYYIPFYHYSNRTTVIFAENKIYVFEHFQKSTEGPVEYKSHYEGLLIKKISGEWKIDQYLYDNIPKSIIKRAEQPEKKKRFLFSLFQIRPLIF